jgi:hypothetical protein
MSNLKLPEELNQRVNKSHGAEIISILVRAPDHAARYGALGFEGNREDGYRGGRHFEIKP